METKFPFEVRRAVAEEEAEILRLLALYKTVGDARTRHRWLYHDNPQGRAVTWLAAEPATGEVVGFTSIFPREFVVDGRTVVGGIGFDAFVRPDRRRMGIAAALHAASHRDMAEGHVPFRFMCGPPAAANLVALLKAGSRVVGTLRTYVRPLTVRGLVEMARYEGPGARGVLGAASVLDSGAGWVRRRLLKRTSRVRVRILDAASLREDGPALDRLWERAQPRFRVVGRRDAPTLAWRFLANPVCPQRIVALESAEGLLGWAALEFAPQGCLLVDHLLAPGDEGAGAALAALLDYAAKEGASRVAVRLNPAGPDARLFRRRGFVPGRKREDLQVLCADPSLLEPLLELRGWHFASGDLNPEATHWSVVTAPDAPWSDANFRATPA